MYFICYLQDFAERKSLFFALFFAKIWSIQKKAVPLQPVLSLWRLN